LVRVLLVTLNHHQDKMRRFLQPAAGATASPAKRPRVDQASDPTSVAQQHAFLDSAKKKDWAAVKKALAVSPSLINVQPLGRWTPLHQAAEAGNTEMVTFLLAQGADFKLKTSDGKTASDVAKVDAVRALFKAAEPVVASVSDQNKDAASSSAIAIGAVVRNDVGVASSIGGVWQLERELGNWVAMASDRQALLNDAKAAGVPKAMCREAGHSFILDLEGCTEINFATGNTRSFRWIGTQSSPPARIDDLQHVVSKVPASSSGTRSSPPALPPSIDTADATPRQAVPCTTSAKEVTPAPDVAHGLDTKGGSELAVGESVDVPGSGAKPYTVKNCGGGVWSCTCVAWKMQGKKPTNERSCKHIAGIRGAAAEQLRQGTTAAVVTPPKRDKKAGIDVISASKADGVKAPPALLLANKWEESVDPTGMWISEKLDGMRAFWDPIRGCLLSRLGNPVLCPKPMLAGLPNVQLDGELFLGRGRFQELMSVVKNGANVGQVDGPWKDVVYVAFDIPDHGGKFEERMEALKTELSAAPILKRN